ncbi:hypothetical protein N7541_006308 [Penicillium brevicompactum]|uniref:Uncharacterized protein n=1 Tax=Penicillium brevicompactum TaxID=5074 RepID=A0A9W9R6X4_PENBR|nr:hypothetical protein N7541_006308 [Penicillium brevicompactum]
MDEERKRRGEEEKRRRGEEREREKGREIERPCQAYLNKAFRQMLEVWEAWYGELNAPGLQNISRDAFDEQWYEDEIRTEKPVWRDSLL